MEVYDVWKSKLPQIKSYFYMEHSWYQHMIDPDLTFLLMEKLPYIIRVKLKR